MIICFIIICAWSCCKWFSYFVSSSTIRAFLNAHSCSLYTLPLVYLHYICPVLHIFKW